MKSTILNPVAGFENFPDGILGFLQNAVGVRLTPEQRGLARQIGLGVFQGREGTLRDFVEAWRAAPELAAFAQAVARAMLPGCAGRK